MDEKKLRELIFGFLTSGNEINDRIKICQEKLEKMALASRQQKHTMQTAIKIIQERENMQIFYDIKDVHIMLCDKIGPIQMQFLNDIKKLGAEDVAKYGDMSLRTVHRKKEVIIDRCSQFLKTRNIDLPELTKDMSFVSARDQGGIRAYAARAAK